MESKYYQRMFGFEETHWWFVGKRSIIFSILDKFYRGRKDLKILDVGCGTGITLTHLKKYGDATGVDDSAIALSLCKKRGHRQLFEAPVTQLPFGEGTFDIVTCFDTLSHQRVKDDLQALRELYRVLKRGGWIITSDPAYNFLWSGMDVSERVRERYTKKGLTKKMKEAGFRIEKASYWNTFLFPLVFTIRMIKNLFLGRNKSSSDLWKVPFLLNKVLTCILKLEAYLLQRINLPLGVSVLCVGEKPKVP